MSADPPRYSRRPFPPYAFVPGRTPHPTRDPDGHSFGMQPDAPASFDAEAGAGNQDFLYAIDLINHDYWWEAHEALEGLWIAAGRRTPAGQFLQGLIQIAVAMLKRHQGMTDAAQRLADAGMARLRGVPDGFMGVDRHDVVARVRACLDQPQAPPLRIRLALPADDQAM